MENHRDEHIACADCGASFLFSAAEAAVFEERGLAAPKRCKDCRRARKDRNQSGGAPARGPRGPRNGQPGHDAAARGPRPNGGRPRMGQGGPRGGDGQRGAPRYGTPRYTGDVNEYRSPMQDGGWQASHNVYRAPAGGNGWQQQQQPRAPRRGGPGVYRHDDGQYRAPSGHVDGPQSYGRQDRPRRPAPGNGNGNGNEAGPRRRPQGETFSITCDSCGTRAEVPFKPAEGREVFCQPCYRARKPPV